MTPDEVERDDFGCDRSGVIPSQDAPLDVEIFGHALCAACVVDLRAWMATPKAVALMHRGSRQRDLTARHGTKATP